MMFYELLANPNRIEPGPLQSAARQRFPDIVQRSHLEYVKCIRQPPDEGKLILIGIAVYSPKELQLLDEVDASYADWKNIAKVAAFDLMECKDPFEVLTNYFLTTTYRPGSFFFKLHPQSPIVGIWDGAVLTSLETGLYNTQKLLRNVHVLK